MRRMIRTTVAAAGLVLALGVASAMDRDEQAPESRAYLGFSFGGQKAAPRDFHYGLRLDHDSRFVEGETAPLMQFDFTRRGFADAKVNGLSVIKQRYRLRQSEEQAAEEAGGEAPAEPAPIEEGAPTEADEGADAGGEDAAAEGAGEGGFFSNMWGGVTGFFGGLFGGGDEEELAEEAPADEAPAESAEAPAEEVAEGPFASYDIVDWGLLAVGVAGVGLAVSEVTGGDETPDSPGFGGGGTTGGTTGGSTTGGGCTTTIGPTGICITISGYAPNRWATGYDERARDPEHQKWLDGGTGQMGDLGGH